MCNVTRYIEWVIQGFNDEDARALWKTGTCKRWKQIETAGLKKLAMLEAASRLTDLKAPPGNRLEALGGDRKGQYSIRINNQWRICFRWTEAGPANVEIVDYH